MIYPTESAARDAAAKLTAMRGHPPAHVALTSVGWLVWRSWNTPT